MIKVNEIFCSIIGEGTMAGMPCAFVRFTGCNLRCSYCDTRYAYDNGIEMSVEQIVRAVRKFEVIPVLITGGEPLLQEEVYELVERLFDFGHVVMIETNGSVSLANVPEDAIIIMDVKCPGSGASERNMLDNLELLVEPDNVKFVLSDKDDYLWARAIIAEYELFMHCAVLMSPVSGQLDPKLLSEWMIQDKLFARLSLQIHKVIWGEDVCGR